MATAAKLRRRGFTLVELMVVISIIGLLIMLLLPAVQAAREAARRVQCRNNLKQLALGIVNYENANKRYPQAGLCGARVGGDVNVGPFDPRGGQMIGWVVLVLPFIEEQSLYQQFDLNRSVLDQPNEPQSAVIRSLVCPSDGVDQSIFVDDVLTSGKRFAKGNYAAFISPVHVAWTDWWPSGLSGTHHYAAKDVADGISKTLVLSEVRTRPLEQDQRGAWALPWTGSTVLAFDMHSTWPTYNYFDWTSILNSSGIRFQPWSASLGETQRPNNLGPNVDMLYACPDSAGAQLDGMPCAVYGVPYSNTYLSAAPRSRHPGGVDVALLDGHVGFLLDNIDEMTMAYLVSSNDGQTIDISQVR
jgi:prepilin-type N-terminal cleavage/methylation domain-containing protein/prepilin-type processing-associated H-X9-DG protein